MQQNYDFIAECLIRVVSTDISLLCNVLLMKVLARWSDIKLFTYYKVEHSYDNENLYMYWKSRNIISNLSHYLDKCEINCTLCL